MIGFYYALQVVALIMDHGFVLLPGDIFRCLFDDALRLSTSTCPAFILPYNLVFRLEEII